MVLWWIAAGHIPSLDEAKARLQELRTNGESDRAFTYRKPYSPPDAIATEAQSRRAHLTR